MAAAVMGGVGHFRLSNVSEVAESVFPVLDEDVVDAPVLVEEPFDVPLPGVVRQVAQEHAGGIAVVASGGHDAQKLVDDAQNPRNSRILSSTQIDNADT